MPILVKDNNEDAKKTGFADEGFPEQLCKAFQYSANATGMIIMSRVPGVSCTRLIEERFDLKGFFIKAKSCNWGPMAGFLCQMPMFNKNGGGGAEFNSKKNKDYFHKYNAFQSYIKENKAVPNDAAEQKIAASHDTFPFSNASLPFVRIKLSEARKKEVLDNQSLYHLRSTPIDDRTIYGIAWAHDESACMEFFLIKEDNNLWGLYHGDLYWARPYEDHEKKPCTQWENFLTAHSHAHMFPYFDDYTQEMPKDGNTTNNHKVLEKITCKLKGDTGDNNYRVLKRKDHAHESTFNDIPSRILNAYRNRSPEQVDGQVKAYPVLGIQNPYAPYSKSEEIYKNAVTGDYDIFAVWNTAKTNAIEEGMTRTSERRVRGNKFHIHTVGNKGRIRLDIIPSFDELEDSNGSAAEDPRWGNISNNVSFAAGMVNDAVHTLRDIHKKADSTNAAFHSDEGGRPSMMDIDLPIGVFAPNSDNPSSAKNIVKFNRAILKTRAEFLQLINESIDSFDIVLNAGWFYALLVHALGKTTITKPDEKTERFSALETEIFSALFGVDTTKIDDAEAFKQCLKGSRKISITDTVSTISDIYQAIKK